MEGDLRRMVYGCAGGLAAIALAAGPATAAEPPTATQRAATALFAHHGAVGAAARPAKGSGVWGGYTSDRRTVLIEVARDGRRVTRALAGIAMRCTSGDELTVPDEYLRLRIRGGRFGTSFRGTDRMGQQQLEANGSVSGRFNRRRTAVSGTWRARAVIRMVATGQVLDTCESGRVRFSAKRRYAGVTSGGWPVVIDLSRDGRTVVRASAGIEAACQSGESLTVQDEWRRLPIRNGRFSGSYRDSGTAGPLLVGETGSIEGRVNRRRKRISGTWRVYTAFRLPQGRVVDTCDSGSLRFTARR